MEEVLLPRERGHCPSCRDSVESIATANIWVTFTADWHHQRNTERKCNITIDCHCDIISGTPPKSFALPIWLSIQSMFTFSPTTLILFVDRHQTPTVYGISDNIVFLITSYERSYRIAVLFTAVCETTPPDALNSDQSWKCGIVLCFAIDSASL